MGGKERKCQRKRNFVPLLEGHKKCDRREEEAKQWRRPKEGK